MYSGALKGIKSNEQKVVNQKLSLPPGIRAFVSDANRANNSYSLQALIKNEHYSQYPQPQSLQEDASLSYGYASSSSDAYDALSPQYHKSSNSLSSGTTEHDGIDSLMAASNQLHEHLKELEVVIHEQLNIVKTSEPSPTDEPPPKEAPTEFMKGSTVYKQLQREGQASLILELRQFIRTLNKGKSYFHKLPENRIVDFIKGNDITWDDFNNNSKKKTFTNPLKKQLKIKYGVAYKLWLKMNWIYNEKIISDLNGIGPTEVNVSEMPIADLSKHRSLIFISEDCTNHAINNGILMEYFSSSKQLFHYLRWTIKMQQIDRYYKIFIVKNTSIDHTDDSKTDENEDKSNHDYDEYVNGFNNKDKRELVIFNTELHSSYNGDMLYIIGTDNDKQTVKSPKWKMEEFMTAVEIYSKYGILPSKLPLGSRSNSDAFRHYRNQKRSRMQVVTGYLRHIVVSLDVDIFSESEGLPDLIILITVMYYDPFYRKHKYSAMRHIPMDKYVKLPQIKTQQKKELHKAEPRQLQFTSYQFYRHILEALDSNDMKHHFLSIVSFDKHKTEYFIDLLLPIKLPTNNYIGIIFRNYIPISICIDCNDMKTKSKLFDASYNIEQYQWMNNNMTRLSILQVPSRDKMLKKMHKHHSHQNHHQQKNQQQKLQQPPQNQQPPRRQMMNPPLTAQSTQGRHKLVLKEAIMQHMHYGHHQYQYQHQQMMKHQQLRQQMPVTSMIRIGMHGMNE